MKMSQFGEKSKQWQCLLILLLMLVMLFAACPANGSDYFVAPDGNDLNDGSIGSPFRTIGRAHDEVVAGDTIFLRGGVHYYTRKISIDNSGASGNRITLQAYQNEVPILDFSGMIRKDRGIQMSYSANYWHLKGFTIRYAGDNGLYTNSSYNIFEQLVTHSNNDSGIQLTANNDGSPAYNLVLNCDSYLNFDPANDGENADGFAAKGASGWTYSLGPGNVFRGCRAWNNSDDGWDFWYAGNSVRVEDCWAFRNGVNLWGVIGYDGDGQGFKLGQGGGEHILIRCMSYNNQHNGFDLNRSTTDATGVTLYNCTGVNNLERNFNFANPSTGAIHVLRNNLSYLGSVTDEIGTLIDDANNSWNGFTVTDADFVSLDPNFDPIEDPDDYTNADSNGIDRPREPDGSLPKMAFLRLSPDSSLVDGGIDVGEPFEGDAPDLGAYEYIAGDCHCDGDVDLDDLECFVDNWLDVDCGTCNGANFDNYGGVDFYDFAMLAGNWLKY